MAKKSMILKQQGPAKFSTRKYNRCKLCGVPTLTCVTTVSAVSASGSWPTRARSPVSARLLSEKKLNRRSEKYLTNCGSSGTLEKWDISTEMCPLRHVQKCFLTKQELAT